MFTLVVLSTLVVVASAAPGYLRTIPVATSHQERVDVIESNPIISVIPEEYYNHDDLHVIDNLSDYDDTHIYEHAPHDHENDIHISPVYDTIIIAAPESHESISSHQEVHQIHDTPLEEDLEIIDVIGADSHDSIVVENAEYPAEEENLHYFVAPLDVFSYEDDLQVHNSPIVHSLPILEEVEDVHHVITPLVSSVKTVESHQEVHQTHPSPVHHSIVSPIVSPIVLTQEVVPQVHHEVPVVQVVPLVKTVESVVPVAVSHTSRTDVHKSVEVLPEIHAW